MSDRIYFDRIIDHATDVFFVLTPEGDFRYSSETVNKVLGYFPDELLDKSYLDFIHPDEQVTAHKNNSLLLSYPGNRITADYRVKNSHGEYLWMEWIFYNMSNIPQVEGILVQMRNITERKETELKLKLSDERFRIFMNNLPGLAWIKDMENNYVFVNEGFCRNAGMPEEEIIGKKVQATVPDEISMLANNDRIVLDYGQPLEYFSKITDHSGSETKDYIVCKFPLPQDKGKSLLGTIAMDVTRLMALESQRASEEKKFQQLFENSPDAIFIEDRQGFILEANPRACELQGISREQLIGTNILELTPDDKKEDVKTFFDKLWSGEINQLLSFTWAANGKEIPIEIRSTRILQNGQDALLLTLRDC